MQINISSNNFYSDTVSMRVVDELESNQKSLELENAILYYEFPIFKELDQSIKYPSFTLISPKHGIIIIQCNGGTNRTLTPEKIDDLFRHISQIYSFIFSTLVKVENLRKKRSANKLNFQIKSILFLPNYQKSNEDDFDEVYLSTDFAELKSLFNDLKSDYTISSDMVNEILSIIECTKGLPKPKDRKITEESVNSKGGLLEQLEKEIATFDEKQKIAALTQIDGPQRIRGLAGSGKTVVLAMKAAYIHMKNPEAKILYTFYTKSLYDHIIHLITRFYRMREDHDPNWRNIHVRHAWGGKSVPGVYYDVCQNNNITPVTYTEAKKKNPSDPFSYICTDLLEQTNGNLKKEYDYVLLDEGQDFSPPFYWLCRAIVKNDCIVWAYDELQNILDVKRQETINLFKNKYGYEGIDLAKLQQKYPRQNNDIILYKCYRNPREILVIAHAIGFGIYSDKIVQRLENKDHWEDMGYEVVEGNCIEGERTVITRPSKNSPSTISDKQEMKEIISWYSAKDFDDEVKWVCNSIKKDLSENLLPEDIMVICMDDRNARQYFNAIKNILIKSRIRTNNILESYTGDDFIMEGCITLTTVYRAKGNEAAIVYVIGSDIFDSFNKNDIILRNKFFTAFTRAKAWLRITGIDISLLINEIEESINKFPNFEFSSYPGEEEINTLRREFAKENQEKNRKLQALQEKIEELGLDFDEAIELMRTRRKDK